MKMTETKNGFRCDECGIIETEPELTLYRDGYADALHFCSLKCLQRWVYKEMEVMEND